MKPTPPRPLFFLKPVEADRLVREVGAIIRAAAESFRVPAYLLGNTDADRKRRDDEARAGR